MQVVLLARRKTGAPALSPLIFCLTVPPACVHLHPQNYMRDELPRGGVAPPPCMQRNDAMRRLDISFNRIQVRARMRACTLAI